MRTITLEDGRKLEISEESYNEMARAIQNKRWRAENGSRYYLINDDGNIQYDKDYRFDKDAYRYKSRNYYPTREESERALEIFNIIRKYEHEFTKEELENIKVGKHSIYIHIFNKSLNIEKNHYYINNTPLFKTEEDAQKCVDEIGYDDYIKYVVLGGIK